MAASESARAVSSAPELREVGPQHPVRGGNRCCLRRCPGVRLDRSEVGLVVTGDGVDRLEDRQLRYRRKARLLKRVGIVRHRGLDRKLFHPKTTSAVAIDGTTSETTPTRAGTSDARDRDTISTSIAKPSRFAARYYSAGPARSLTVCCGLFEIRVSAGDQADLKRQTVARVRPGEERQVDVSTFSGHAPREPLCLRTGQALQVSATPDVDRRSAGALLRTAGFVLAGARLLLRGDADRLDAHVPREQGLAFFPPARDSALHPAGWSPPGTGGPTCSHAGGAHFLATQQAGWPPLYALTAEAFDAVKCVAAAAGDSPPN